MRSAAVAVGTTAVLVIAADDTHRTVYIHHESDNNIYLGGDNVSTTNGLHLKKGSTREFVVPSRQTIYAISDTAAQEVRILTPDID